MFSLILQQTITHAFRKGGGAFGTLAFYIIILTLFAFALGPNALEHYVGAVMCVALLLAVVSSMPMLYERDYEDGMMEQFLLQPIALEFIVLAKLLGQWASIILPILLVSPLVTLMAGSNVEAMIVCMISLSLASFSLISIASLAAALTIGSKRGGLLQALIMLPLATPVLIFAATTSGQGAWLFLAGLAFVSVPVACFISAALVRASCD